MKYLFLPMLCLLTVSHSWNDHGSKPLLLVKFKVYVFIHETEIHVKELRQSDHLWRKIEWHGEGQEKNATTLRFPRNTSSHLNNITRFCASWRNSLNFPFLLQSAGSLPFTSSEDAIPIPPCFFHFTLKFTQNSQDATVPQLY